MNNKGFTLIELVLGFVLVTIIVIPLFNVVLNYKEKQSKEAAKAELTSYKNILTYDIQRDLTGVGYKDINIGTDKDIENINALTITLNDDSSTKKELIIDKSNNTIKYGGVKYPLNDQGKILAPTSLVQNDSYFKIRSNSISIAIPIKNIAKLGKKYDYGIYVYAEKTS